MVFFVVYTVKRVDPIFRRMATLERMYDDES